MTFCSILLSLLLTMPLQGTYKPPGSIKKAQGISEVLAAGSTERYQSDPDDDSDWYDMPTLVYRVPNAALTGGRKPSG